MFILQTFIEAFAQILHTAINVYIWIVIIHAVVSWVRPDPYNPIVQVLNKLTLPVYGFFRRRFNTVISGVDLSPLIVIFGLQFIDLFVVKLLFHFASAI